MYTPTSRGPHQGILKISKAGDHPGAAHKVFVLNPQISLLGLLESTTTSANTSSAALEPIAAMAFEENKKLPPSPKKSGEKRKRLSSIKTANDDEGVRSEFFLKITRYYRVPGAFITADNFSFSNKAAAAAVV